MSAPIVILPGLLCDSRMFQEQVKAFGAVVIDGFYGDADRITAMAEYVLDRMPPRAAIIGHSMGGRIALEIIRLAPDRVSRLALANTGIHQVRAGEAESRYRLRDLGREQGAEALVDQWLPPMIGVSRQNDQGLYGQLRAMAVDAGVNCYARQIEALLNRPDAGAVLSRIDCPLMAIVGREDRWSPVIQHEEIVARVPGARLRIIEHAGHMSPAEQPLSFNEALKEWVEWRLPNEADPKMERTLN